MTKEGILQLSRSQVRYQLYRIRTAIEGGAFPTAVAAELKEYYETQEGFTSWDEFAREWDLDIEGQHHKIVKREITEEQEWNRILASEAADLPLKRIL